MFDWFEKKNEFGLGHKSWATLRAIRNKLVIQYRPLIARLRLRFSEGPMGDTLEELDGLVYTALGILQDILDSGQSSKEDQQELLNSIGRIEHLLTVLSRHEKQDIYFAQGLKGVEQDLGIALRDLTVTRGIAVKGLRTARQTPTGRMLGQTKDTVKQGYSDVLSSISSLAGPFAPVANLALKGASAGIGTGAQALFGGRKSTGDGGASSRAQPWDTQRSGEGQDFLQSMHTFYNTDAYKTKWTRELIDTLKGKIGATGEKHGILDTIKELGLLGGAAKLVTDAWGLIPSSVKDVVGKLGAAAALIGATIWTIQQYKKLIDAIKDREVQAANARKSASASEVAQNQVLRAIGNMTPEQKIAFQKDTGQTLKQYGTTATGRLQTAQTARYKNRPSWAKDWGIANPFIEAFVGGVDKPKVLPYEQRLAQVMNRQNTSYDQQKTDYLAGRKQNYAQSNNTLLSPLERIAAKLDELNKTTKTGQQKTTVPFSGSSSPRNSYDSSDMLLDQFLHGTFNFGER